MRYLEVAELAQDLPRPNAYRKALNGAVLGISKPPDD
jgi:hypothetical protein